MSVAPPEAPPRTADPDQLLRPDEKLLEGLDQPWITIVWNDPVNLMSYVSWVFRTHFGYSKEKAELLMMQVHNDGRSVVSRGTREKMESDTEAMHGFGLWATLKKDD